MPLPDEFWLDERQPPKQTKTQAKEFKFIPRELLNGPLKIMPHHVQVFTWKAKKPRSKVAPDTRDTPGCSRRLQPLGHYRSL